MYNLFDKVLILDKGMCMYFGYASQAKKYFEDMGFMCEPRKSMRKRKRERGERRKEEDETHKYKRHSGFLDRHHKPY
jgi:ABC-type multidrug transport system ATPase subunit